MELQLKNIGMIKEANVKIDGLTVIAGENDTGKSTVGKALYLLTRTAKIDFSNKNNLMLASINKIFSGRFFEINQNILMKLITKDETYSYMYKNKYPKDSNKVLYNWRWEGNKPYNKDVVFIETPLVWNLQDMFRTSSDIESHLKLVGESIDIPYPFLMKDLYFKLTTIQKYSEEWTAGFSSKITSIINGEFIKEEDGIFRFSRDGIKYDLIDVATGIKTFGILQVLINNNRLNSNSLLILDEPEVHLHPKWQLEMAKIIVELVKNGVKIVVNSHSPYMIEALKRYSDLEAKVEDKINFYLADDGYIKYQDSLENIFEKLAEPMRDLKELKWQSLK